MTDYLTLSQFKRTLKTGGKSVELSNVGHELIERASATMELYTGRRFDHRVETVYHSALPLGQYGDVSDRDLLLREDLQSVTTLVNGDSASLSSGVYRVIQEPHKRKYADRIRLTDATVSWEVNEDNPQDSIAITGVWGWGGTWRSTGLTLGSAADSDDTTLTLAATASGTLERRQIVRLGTEYLLINADVSAGTTLTVERGVNGSTAVAHDSGAALSVFIPDSIAATLCARFAQWFYMLDTTAGTGNFTSVADVEYSVDVSRVPKDIRDLLPMMTRPQRFNIRGTVGSLR